ncbi:MAG: polysaccharide biosynthesis tyrosine autokinase [Ardenticatenaceae bacterium]|nr:polysaccharide biosynthesis tyrosine autokinase [Ardenticatenaceae bacterium]
MEILQYVYLLRRWLWLILLVAVVAGSTTYFVSRTQRPIYRATSMLLIIEDNSSRNNAYNTLLTSERLASSYAERLTNFYVLQAAINSLDVDLTPADLEKILFVDTVGQTNLLAVSVEHSDPQLAADIANTVPQFFIERTQAQQLDRLANSKASLEEELMGVEEEIALTEQQILAIHQQAKQDESSLNQLNETLLRLRNAQTRLVQSLEDLRLTQANQLETVVIDEYARPPEQPVRPRVLTNTMLATIAGIMLAVGVAFLMEYLDDTVKDPEEVEYATGLGTLGILEQLKTNIPSEALVVAREPRSPAAEAYRQVRTNIQFVNLDKKSKTLLITSAQPSEGKTTVAANLAIALAQSGRKVILVDCDMRRPMLHKLLEVNSSRGLCDMIIRGRNDTSYISGTLVPNLRLLPAGRIPPNPAELLGSERMRSVIAWLQTQADIVVFDSPPVLAVTDAVILSQITDLTLFVVSASTTRYPSFIDALERIATVEAPIAGVVLNKVDPQRDGSYYASYYKIDYQPGVVYPPSWRQRLAKLGFTTLFH